MPLYLVLLALASAVALRAADPLPLFNAMLTVGNEQRFVIVSPTGRISSWLRVGETFDGCTLRAFDAKAGVLEVERNGTSFALHLVPDAVTLNAPVESPAILSAAEAALESMRFERMFDKILAHCKQAQLGLIDEIVTRFRQPEVEKEALGELKRNLAETISAALNALEIRAGIAQSYGEIFSAEELSGLAAYYNAPFAQKVSERQSEVFSQEELVALAVFRESPLGQKLEAKQAELEQKVNAVLAPRVQAATAKLRQMTKAFDVDSR